MGYWSRYGSKFLKGNVISSSNFKGLSPFTTPFGERNIIRIVESTIPKVIILSIPKNPKWRLWKLSFWGLSLVIWYNDLDSCLEDYRKKASQRDSVRSSSFCSHPITLLLIKKKDNKKGNATWGDVGHRCGNLTLKNRKWLRTPASEGDI